MSTVDVAKVMSELRAGIRKARAAAAPTNNGNAADQNGRASEETARDRIAMAEPPFNDSVSADLASLHSGYDIIRAPFYSHRRTMSRAIIAAKNFARELMMQILVRQVTYNGANARVVSHLQYEIATLRDQINQAATRAAHLEVELRTSIRDELRNDLRGELRAEFQAELQSALAAAAEERKRERSLPDFDLKYFQFEQLYRGSEAEIAKRQSAYVSSYEGRSEVLDLGCGRGEFLELLRKAGISYQGVDANPEMVAHCRRKGLEVVHGDAIEYLEKLRDESLGGIFCAQMIEHLEPARVIAVVRLCERKLRPGGVLVIETPNPGCLMIFADGFYKDLTHIRPYHPASLKFLLESADFKEIELKFSSPVDPSVRLPRLEESSGPELETFNHGIDLMNDLIYGYQDYAVVARKSATPRSPNHRSTKS
jgi:2-polyprenyl-3-methyl-5-hydroxy-6-metoxy-1,4-benzoquinol methylase